MKIKLLIYFSIISLFVVACSSTAKLSLNDIQTPTEYRNKIPLKVTLDVPTKLINRRIKVNAALACNVWWEDPKVDINDSYVKAIKSGLSSAIKVVKVSESNTSHNEANTNKNDLTIEIKMLYENTSISHNQGARKTSISSNFEVSFILKFIKRNGQILYSYTTEGSAFHQVSGGCSKMAESIKRSIKSALEELANNIAQAAHSSSQLWEFSKKINKR